MLDKDNWSDEIDLAASNFSGFSDISSDISGDKSRDAGDDDDCIMLDL